MLPVADHSHSSDGITPSFIIKLQHLIETCLTFYLDGDECVRALEKHAGIEPMITSVVWKELEKANKTFFEAYKNKLSARRSYGLSQDLEEATTKLSKQRLTDLGGGIEGE